MTISDDEFPRLDHNWKTGQPASTPEEIQAWSQKMLQGPPLDWSEMPDCAARTEFYRLVNGFKAASGHDASHFDVFLMARGLMDATGRTQTLDLTLVTRPDANNYCKILSLLGMEEEGDPVAEVQRLRDEVAAWQGNASEEELIRVKEQVRELQNELAVFEFCPPAKAPYPAPNLHNLLDIAAIHFTEGTYGWPDRKTHDALIAHWRAGKAPVVDVFQPDEAFTQSTALAPDPIIAEYRDAYRRAQAVQAFWIWHALSHGRNPDMVPRDMMRPSGRVVWCVDTQGPQPDELPTDEQLAEAYADSKATPTEPDWGERGQSFEARVVQLPAVRGELDWSDL